jgi:hypothetical protein
MKAWQKIQDARAGVPAGVGRFGENLREAPNSARAPQLYTNGCGSVHKNLTDSLWCATQNNLF